jgi:hypothetical protein
MQFRQGGITQNTKGLSKHEHTVSNCEFFLSRQVGYTSSSPLKLGSPYCAPKPKLMRCKNVTFFLPFITFLSYHSPLYHKSKNAAGFNCQIFVTTQLKLSKLKHFDLMLLIFMYYEILRNL